jgi:hypothetical protein
MSIDTKLDGSPGQIRDCSRWLRSQLAVGVDDCATQMHHARGDAEWGWGGDAGPAFQARMESARKKADDLRTDIERAAGSFDAYANDLESAMAGMERARSIAAQAGLQLAGLSILDPGPAPVVEALPADRPATAQDVSRYNDGVSALNAHNTRVQAYNAAAEEADRSRRIMDAARAIGKNVWDDIRGKAVLQAADLVNGAVVGGLAATQASILNKQAKALLAESKLAAEHYMKAPGGSAEARALNAEAYRKFLDADEFTRRAGTVGRRVGGKVPVVGLAITAAGIGYDIHQGKPAGKAIISGVGGALAAAGTGAVVGTMIGGPLGTVVGAGAGLVVGLVVGGGLDWGYDQLPQGVKSGIEDGIKEVGNAVGDAGEAVGEGAKRIWNSIF